MFVFLVKYDLFILPCMQLIVQLNYSCIFFVSDYFALEFGLSFCLYCYHYSSTVKYIIMQKVTQWNVDKLRHAIMNGANIHPGATHYMDKDRPYRLNIKSMCKSISRKLPTSRLVSNENGKGPEYDFEGKVVYRHLQDGDIVLVNRQVMNFLKAHYFSYFGCLNVDVTTLPGLLYFYC